MHDSRASEHSPTRQPAAEPPAPELAEPDDPLFPVDDCEYQPMPPKRSFTIDVWMAAPQRGRPLPFPLDEIELP